MGNRIVTTTHPVDHFNYRVEWSQAHKKHVGLVAEFTTLSFLAADPVDAREGIKQKVAEHLGSQRQPRKVKMTAPQRSIWRAYLVADAAQHLTEQRWSPDIRNAFLTALDDLDFLDEARR